MAEHTNLKQIPSLSGEYRRLMLGMAPVVGTRRAATSDPTSTFTVTDVAINRGHLADYNKAVGFRTTSHLPLTYPYVLSFPVVLRAMSAPDFPFGAVGAVHLSNVIEQCRPIGVDEQFNINVYATNLRGHRRGLIVDVLTEIDAGGEVVWRQTSTFLGKGAELDRDADFIVVGRGHERGTRLEAPAIPAAAHAAQWRVTAADIKDYAQASGDKNPVHVSPLGAKAFGFPNVIAHGMWTAAKMLTLLEGRTGDALRYTVDFSKPVVLPARVSCWAERSGDGWLLQARKGNDPQKLYAAGLVETL